MTMPNHPTRMDDPPGARPPGQKEAPALAAYGLAVLLAAAYLLCLLPSGFLAGRGGFFETGDPSQHISGWLFYAKDSWRFPLLHTDRLNFPEGVSIVFTDSIPLAAVLFKALRPWLPPGFHYFGLWYAAAFVLQAVTAAFLIRALGRREAFATAAAVIFALTWPAFMHRLGHAALMTHGLLLLSLAAYFLGRGGRWRSGTAASALTAISLIAMLVHPYLLAMCLAVLLAYLVDQAVGGEGWKRQALRLGTALAAVAVVGVVFGYFTTASTEALGFRKYSMNLAAPFLGGLLTPGVTDATGGQYEGFNYFGAGGLLLLVYACATRQEALRSVPRRYPALLALLLLLTAYALSSRVFFGTHMLFEYGFPPFLNWVKGTFRASGRFFWVVGYVALFSALAGALAGRSKRGVLVVAALLVLQWIDLGPLRDSFRAGAARPAPADSVDWAETLSGVEIINMYPAFGCGETGQEGYLDYQRLAAKYGIRINTGYIARAGGDCQAKQDLFESGFAPQSLYVMPLSHLRYHPFQVPAGFRQAADKGECIASGGVILCRAGKDPGSWKNEGFDAAPFGRFPSLARWGVGELATQVGLRSGDLIAGQEGQPGFLAFGPHTRLSPGTYRYAIAFVGNAGPGEQLGRWTCLLDAFTPEERVVASGGLPGTGGRAGSIGGVVRVEKSGAYLDFGVEYFGRGELGVSAFSLKKEE